MSRGASVALGLVADRLLGERLTRPHPVAALGSGAAALERWTYGNSVLRGAAHAALVTVGASAVAAPLPLAATTYICTSGRMLGDVALRIHTALDARDLEAARSLLPHLVGRNPAGFGEPEIARATVESVAENCVDAVVAPALWGVVGGSWAVAAHRALNTLDSMVGHRDERHERFGKASARADDAAAWVPARVTAVLVAAVRPRRARAIARAVAKDAPGHPSPNAGVAEAAFAAALDVTLGGTNRYGDRIEHRSLLGRGRRPSADDIPRAVALLRDVTLAAAGLCALVPPRARR